MTNEKTRDMLLKDGYDDIAKGKMVTPILT